MDKSSHTWIGKSVLRKEDPRLLTGRGLFTGNIQLNKMLYLSILRSPIAHAKILRIDTARARALRGVVFVVTGQDAKAMWAKPLKPRFADLDLAEYPMAWDRVRYVGEPVAAVVATEKGIAEDALDLIDFEYQELPMILDPQEALERDAPLVHEELGTNIYVHKQFNFGNSAADFKRADLVIKDTFRLHRYSSTPLEPDTIIADYDEITGMLTFYSNLQGQKYASLIPTIVGIAPEKFRNIHGDAGGSFGERVSGTLFAACIVALLSVKLGRPVKYIADRREMMFHGGSKRGIYEAELAVMNDGSVIALRLKDITEEGAVGFRAGYYNTIKLTNITGLYKIKSFEMDSYNVGTNVAAGASNRGLSKPHMSFVLERMMDMAAERLGIDPVEIRLKNILHPDDLPYITPSGNFLDTGNFPLLLDSAIIKIEYHEWRRKQTELRKEGRYIGIGVACSVDPGAANPGREFILKKEGSSNVGATTAASVRIYSSGDIEVAIAAVNEGQGHETAVAQVVAEELGVSYDDVNVVPLFDSASVPWTPQSGTGADHFAMTDMGAIVGAARKIKWKILKIGANLLKATPEELEICEGKVRIKGSPDLSISMKKIVSIAYHDTMLLPEGVEPGLHENCYFTPGRFTSTYPSDDSGRATAHMTYGSQVHVVVVEVSPETGRVEILRYVATHDSGVIINPTIVNGQFQGHATHAISVALGEGYIYDENGQLITGTFMDYLKPTATEVPTIEIEHFEFPAKHTVLGSKPVGEGPFNCPMAAITNAVVDALRPFGVQFTELPLTPETIWHAIRNSDGKSLTDQSHRRRTTRIQ